MNDANQRAARAAPLLAVLVVVLMCAGLVIYSRRPGDFAGYIAVGDATLAGRHIYREVPPGINTWPPFFSLLCVPLSLLARPTPLLARALWILLNYLSLWLVLGVIVRRLERPRREAVATAMTATALMSPYLLSNFEHLQINLILFALTLVGLDRVWSDRERSGAVAIGVAAAIKVMPVFFLPYLLARRRFRASAWLVSAGFLASLSPVLVFGWSHYRDYLHSWRRAVAVGWGAGPMNQSVLAMWDRWLGHGASAQAPIVRVAWALSLLLIVAVSARRFRGGRDGEQPRVAHEWSVVFLVAALFGPVTWKAYLVVMTLPVALLLGVSRDRDADRPSRIVALATVAISTALSWLTAKELWGAELTVRFATLSVATWSGLVMLAGLLCLGHRPAKTVLH